MQISTYKSGISVLILSAVLAATAFVCFLPPDVWASWHLYHEEPGGEKHYYDTESIVEKRERKRNSRVYRKSVTVEQYIKISEKTVFGNAIGEIKELKAVMEFHCPYGKIRLLKTDKTYKNGRRSIVMKTGVWEDIKTGSGLEELYKKLCTLK